MTNDVLALKYRPKFFNEVTGQDLAVDMLSNSIKLNKIHHAYLFSGTRGVGKTTIARLFAKSLLCNEGISNTPCGKCNACIEIDKGNHLDLIEIDAASRTKVEDTRTLMENVQYSPTSSRFKIYLIDEVHMLSDKSFNALLKTIEEPPEHVKFLLATTEPDKLPETVLSRCLHFKLNQVDFGVIASHLKNILEKENIEYDNESLDLISKNAKGSLRDSLSILEQCISYCNGSLDINKIKTLMGHIDEEIIQNIILKVIHKSPEDLISIIEGIQNSISFEKLLDSIIDILYKLSLYKINPKIKDNFFDNDEFYNLTTKNISSQDLQLFYQIAISAKKDIPLTPNQKDYFSMIMLRMIYFFDDDASDTDNVNSVPDNSKGIDFDWNKIIDQLNISGITLELARHCVLIKKDDDNFSLMIDQKKQDIFPKSCLSDFFKILNNFFKKEYKYEVIYQENLKTPDYIQKEKMKTENNIIYNKASKDPNINNIKEIFGSDIDKKSIKKIKDVEG
ncbi:MAG: DNA polymerase III, subunit gamma and tau [Gammaproteobacteria bacterium]|nr:DNA polymerase III, subunit gamma and tau [Gammaproteobacteria bacterium]|tara:strand:+ start:97048 stop:98568 length:1521 start_codon:yes stop_codon:yes gene_type:complete